MILRTTGNSAANQAAFTRMDEVGCDVIVVSSHLGARPKCSLVQGKLFSRSGTTKTVKDKNGAVWQVGDWNKTSYGEPDGILGINCRHHIGMFFEGLSENKQEQVDETKNRERYEQEQKQRKLERELRKAKRERDVAKEIGDEDGARYANAKVRAKSKELRSHIEEFDLRRNRVRERYFASPSFTISGSTIETRNAAEGTAPAIYWGHAKLNNRQKKLDAILTEAGDQHLFTKREVSLKDIAALTAKNDCEYALFTRGNQRLLTRGTKTNAGMPENQLRQLAREGWRFSGHTHPGVGEQYRIPSQGDRNVLELFKQRQSVILDSVGGFDTFEKEELFDEESTD